jgi:hypothetical protein
MSDDQIQIIFDELLTECGGKAVFSAVQLGACRRLAMLLGGSEPIVPSQISALKEMLPARPAADDSVWRLELLTDSEFKTFSRLYEIAQGKRAPSPAKPHRFPKRSWRQLHVDQTVLLLDQIEGEALHRRGCWRCRRCGRRLC